MQDGEVDQYELQEILTKAFASSKYTAAFDAAIHFSS